MIYKEVKIWIKVLVLILAVPFFNSCGSDTVTLVGNWVELSVFDGLPRADAAGFSIGTKGYIGTGWEGKYRLKDFYEYNPASNVWNRKADFGGSARRQALAMTINNKGYVGTGDSVSYFKDFWEYDPSTDIWTKKSSIGGNKRISAAGFVISGKGYFVGGFDNGDYLTDMWQYDPGADSWTKKRSIADITDQTFDDEYSTIKGRDKVGFTINGKGYVATGGMTTGIEVWEYDPGTDLWIEKTNFEGTSRQAAVGFAIGSRGYVVTGSSSGLYFDDIWAFDPDAELNEDD